MKLGVAITGIGLWLPGFADVAAWLGRARDASLPAPQGLAYDRVNRRRASGLGRALGDAVAQALQMAAVEPSRVAVVVGSSIGEAATMIGLLEQMFRTREPVSPAAFTVSVHNAASGLLSIAQRNTGFTTSLAADDDTPAAALLEGAGLIAAGHDAVVVACADEASPEGLLTSAPAWHMLAAAVVLRPPDAQALARLWLPVDGPPTLPGADVPDELARNPQVGLLDVVDAALRRRAGVLRLDRGGGRGVLAAIEPEPLP